MRKILKIYGEDHETPADIQRKENFEEEAKTVSIVRSAPSAEFRFIVGNNHIDGQQDVPGLRDLLSAEITRGIK